MNKTIFHPSSASARIVQNVFEHYSKDDCNILSDRSEYFIRRLKLPLTIDEKELASEFEVMKYQRDEYVNFINNPLNYSTKYAKYDICDLYSMKIGNFLSWYAYATLPRQWISIDPDPSIFVKERGILYPTVSFEKYDDKDNALLCVNFRLCWNLIKSPIMLGNAAELIAYDLGFENIVELQQWAHDNPGIWGNTYGELMFETSRAFAAADNERVTLKTIADHWKGVADRLELREKQL